MAGGAAGSTPNQGQAGQGFPAQPQTSQASQYSNYGAQPNGAFYAGPNAGAPAGSVQMGALLSDYAGTAGPGAPAPQAQANKPQGGFGGNQGYGSMGQGFGQSYGGMDAGFRSPFAPPVQSSPFGGMYGPQQYGYGGMGNQFMGGMGGFPGQGYGQGYGGMGGSFGQGYGQNFGPYGGRPARDFGPQAEVQAPPPGFRGQTLANGQPAPQSGRTEEDWNRFAASAQFAPGTDMEQAKQHWMAQKPRSMQEVMDSVLNKPGYAQESMVAPASGNPFSQADRINSLMRSLNPFTADAKPLPSFARPNDMRDFGPQGQDAYQQYTNTPGNPQLSQEEWAAQNPQAAVQQPTTTEGGLAGLQRAMRGGPRGMGGFGGPRRGFGGYGGGRGFGGGFDPRMMRGGSDVVGADGWQAQQRQNPQQTPQEIQKLQQLQQNPMTMEEFRALKPNAMF